MTVNIVPNCQQHIIRFFIKYKLEVRISDYLLEISMRWAGHVARMGEERGRKGCWWGMRWTGHVARMGEEKGRKGSCWRNRREVDYWRDLGVDGWIILGWISRRWDVGIWNGLGWPRIETGGGRL